LLYLQAVKAYVPFNSLRDILAFVN
jgi:hypothetical protein